MSCVILGTHSQYLTPCSSSSFTLMTKGIYKKRKRKKKREKRSKKVKERGELTESSYSHTILLTHDTAQRTCWTTKETI